jgi:hypothetical protein
MYFSSFRREKAAIHLEITIATRRGHRELILVVGG